jgi:hypothetical protein
LVIASCRLALHNGVFDLYGVFDLFGFGTAAGR